MRWIPLTVLGTLACLGVTLVAQSSSTTPIDTTVSADRPGADIAPTMVGIFFEDINFGADGGLSAEKIKNRSFEFADGLMGWKRAWVEGTTGQIEVRTDVPPSAANTHYVRVRADRGRFGVANGGFRGVGIRKGERYTVSLLARRQGTDASALVVGFENTRNETEGEATIRGIGEAWTRHRVTLTAATTDARARFRVLLDGPGTIDMDMVSVFPEDTRAGRENGLRRGSGGVAARNEARLPPLSRGLHRRGTVPGRALPVDVHDRRPGGSSPHRQSLERRVPEPGHSRLLPVLRARLLRVLPAVRGSGRRADAHSELRHGVPVQLR
jgi:hypothetical protein